MSPNMNTGKVIVEWEFPEYDKKERSSKWFMWLGIIAGLFLIISLVTYNYLFSILIAMFVVILFFRYNKEPEIIKFSITEHGMILSDDFTPFRDFDSFWIIYNPPLTKTLNLHKKSVFNSIWSVPLLNMNPLFIRETLLTNLDEDIERDEESVAEVIGRIFKI